MIRYALLLAFALVTPAAPVLAASSAWHDAAGARVRLVTTGQADGDGLLRGVLQIELKPGWKTYWRDPGASGVPPSIDVSATTALQGLEMDYPAPERHGETPDIWAGYAHSVGFPLTFKVKPGAVLELIDAAVFLGVCEKLCVPVQATLTLDPRINADSVIDAQTVSLAFSQAPQAATPQFGARIVKADYKKVILEVDLPKGVTKADMFLAGDRGYMFGAPHFSTGGGKPTFTFDVLTTPRVAPADGSGLHYTLVTPDQAVSGTVPYF